MTNPSAWGIPWCSTVTAWEKCGESAALLDIHMISSGQGVSPNNGGNLSCNNQNEISPVRQSWAIMDRSPHCRGHQHTVPGINTCHLCVISTFYCMHNTKFDGNPPHTNNKGPAVLRWKYFLPLISSTALLDKTYRLGNYSPHLLYVKKDLSTLYDYKQWDLENPCNSPVAETTFLTENPQTHSTSDNGKDILNKAQKHQMNTMWCKN